MFACLHAPGSGARVTACAQNFSPLVEQTGPDTVILDIGGLGRLYGSVYEIAQALAARLSGQVNVAIASNPDAAFHAALGFTGISIVPHGDEAKFLATLPVELLSPSPETAETLARWGIRTFRDLAALPDIGVAARLGEEGVRLQGLSRGEASRPLVPIEMPPRFESKLELDDPVDLLEPLLFVLGRLLGDVCAQLEERALSAIELRLWLKLENAADHTRSLRLPVPMRNPRLFLKLLELDLGAHPPPAPVCKAGIAAEPAKPRTAQSGLFIPLAPEPEKLELTLARIAALVGKENTGTPELVDTHRPGAFRMAAPLRAKSGGAVAGSESHRAAGLAFRSFRPPLAAKVQGGFVAAGGVRGKIVRRAGPWRTSGDWWTAGPWARDEWDVELTDGALYRFYCEHESGRWFLEGSYD